MNGVGLTRSVRPVLGWISIVYLTFGIGLGTVTATESYLLLQSTTSTVNSGLLDAILPHFTKQTGVEVRVVSSGTGQALRNARNGDADLVLVHSKRDEEKFVAEGTRPDCGRRNRQPKHFQKLRPPELISCPAAMSPAPTRKRSVSGALPIVNSTE